MSAPIFGRSVALAAVLVVTAACASSHKVATAGSAALATGSSAASTLTAPASAPAEPMSPTPTADASLTPTAAASAPAVDTPGVPPPATAVPAGSGVIVSEKDNGHALGVRMGETVELELHSLYWKVAPATGGALTEKGTATMPPAPGQAVPGVPGSGAGTIDVTYVATAAGSATISAHRDTCGEALRCGPDQSDFTVTITVS